MQVFFVVDSNQNLENKIALIQTYLCTDIKFFVNSKFYTKIYNNKYIVDNLVKVFEDNEKEKIDEYIKSDKFHTDDVLLYYSSVKLNAELLKEISKKKIYNYDAIYFKKKENFLTRFFNKIYKKIINLMFRVDDALASVKLQYLSKAFIENLKVNKFHNHILKAQNSTEIEMEDKAICKTLSTQISFNKKNLYLILFFAIIILVFLILDLNFKLMFWAYFLFVMLILLTVALAIMLAVENIFRSRYKK